MSVKVASPADRIARDLAGRWPTWDEVRDHCDLATGSALDALQLDLLADAVARRLEAARGQK